MSSTLRSLVLRYKADHKDFSRGTEQVKKELRQTKEAVLGIDKTMKQSFKAGSVDGMRAEIKALNAVFTTGKIDVRRYGDEVDRLKQKIASVQRFGAIRGSELGALANRRAAAAGIERDLRRSFGTGGSMAEESAAMMRERMGGSGGSSAASRAGLFGMSTGGTKKFIKRLMPLAGPLAAFKMYGDASAESEAMAQERPGTWRHAAGQSMQGAWSGPGSILKLPGKGLATGVGAVADMISGGAISRGAALQREAATTMREANDKRRMNNMRDWARAPIDQYNDERTQGAMRERYQKIADTKGPGGGIQELERQAEMNERLSKSTGIKESTRVQALDELRRLNEAIVAAKEKENALDQEWITAAKVKEQAEEARKGAIGDSINAMRREIEIAREVASGGDEFVARLRQAGATDDQLNEAAGLAREHGGLTDPAKGEFFGSLFATVANDIDRAIKGAGELAAFKQQFNTPQESFAANLNEIGRMQALGLSPEVAERAMKRAAEQAGQQSINAFAPNVTKGSGDDARLMRLNEARIAGRDKTDKLIEIAKEQLDALKDGMKVEITVEDVTF